MSCARASEPPGAVAPITCEQQRQHLLAAQVDGAGVLHRVDEVGAVDRCRRAIARLDARRRASALR